MKKIILGVAALVLGLAITVEASANGPRGPGLCRPEPRLSFVDQWRRGESNPGPQGIRLNLVHVRSRITRAAGFLNSVRT